MIKLKKNQPDDVADIYIVYFIIMMTPKNSKPSLVE